MWGGYLIFEILVGFQGFFFLKSKEPLGSSFLKNKIKFKELPDSEFLNPVEYQVRGLYCFVGGYTSWVCKRNPAKYKC
jgi:hypothetical protein